MNTHAWSHAVPSQGARCPPRLEKSRQCCTCCSTQAESLRPPFCQTDNTGACTHALVRRCMLEHAAFACAHKFYARGAMAAECCPSCPAARMPWTPESVHAGLSETTVGCTRAADSGASQRPEEPQRVRLAAARRGCPCARVPAPRVAQLCVKRLLSPWVEQARLTCKVLPRGWLPQAERGHDARQVLQAVQDHRVCARHAACVSARAALAPEHHRKAPPPPPPAACMQPPGSCVPMQPPPMYQRRFLDNLSSFQPAGSAAAWRQGCRAWSAITTPSSQGALGPGDAAHPRRTPPGPRA